MQLLTHNGYGLAECASAMQKAIRRNKPQIAGFFALEMAERYHAYVWKRLLICSAEDLAGVITQEVIALHDAFLRVNEGKPKKLRGKVMIAKAVLLMCKAPKSRDADHLVCVVPHTFRAERLEAAYAAACKGPLPPLPEYTFDCHTVRGRRNGKTRADFFQDEFLALQPREEGVFDSLITPTQLANIPL
jgi:hypothetical protein